MATLKPGRLALSAVLLGSAAAGICRPLTADATALVDAPAADAAAASVADAALARAASEFKRGDVTAALSLLRPLAETGYLPAQVRLAYYLDYAEDDAAALRWYTAAAEAGDPEAQFYLAKLYGAGEGTSPDPVAALDWYRRAAEQGYLPATRVLAMSYERGGPLAPISYESAVAWLEAGAALGDEWSLRRLSDAYRRGELGLRVDRHRATALAARADALAEPEVAPRVADE